MFFLTTSIFDESEEIPWKLIINPEYESTGTENLYFSIGIVMCESAKC